MMIRFATAAMWRAAVMLAFLCLAALILRPDAANAAGTGADQEAAAQQDSDAEAADGPAADLAYGAYQRGQYLTAFELALPRAQLGDPAAQTLIAELYDKGLGVARDPAEATAWYGIAARNNNLEAQFAYAVRLLEGKYVEKDAGEARRLMRIAADAGHATAAYNYGRMILDERPTAAGVREAMPFLERAANAGVAEAGFALAQIHASGKLNGFADYQTGFPFLRKAATGGIPAAQVELAIWLANGWGTPADGKAAFGWMSRAAVSGNTVARNRVAKMLAQGIGTQQNRIEAAMWHILARRDGLTDPWLDEFMSSLSREELARAIEEANHWMNR